MISKIVTPKCKNLKLIFPEINYKVSDEQIICGVPYIKLNKVEGWFRKEDFDIVKINISMEIIKKAEEFEDFNNE